VDESTSSRRPSAVLARRLVQRTLVVLGGAAAATALAWWLSSTSAAADTATPPTPQVPVVSDASADPLAPVTDALTTITDQLRAPLDESLRDFEQAAQDFGEQAQQQWNQLPECSACDLDQLDDLGGTPSDDGGRMDAPAPQQGVPGLVLPVVLGPVADAGVDADALAEDGAVDRAYADGGPRRGSPEPEAPMPGFPTWPTPVAPAAPATGQTGQNNGGSMDGVLFAALPWTERIGGTAVARMLTATQATPFGRPGAQPGVSPD
jgi:hypothetical protein